MSEPQNAIQTAITNVFCSRTSKPHRLADIVADPAGLVLRYASAVHTTQQDSRAVQSPQDGMYYLRDGAVREYPLSPNETTQLDVWCRSCRTAHPVDTLALFKAAAESRRKSVTLTSRGAYEGFWR